MTLTWLQSYRQKILESVSYEISPLSSNLLTFKKIKLKFWRSYYKSMSIFVSQQIYVELLLKQKLHLQVYPLLICHLKWIGFHINKLNWQKVKLFWKIKLIGHIFYRFLQLLKIVIKIIIIECSYKVIILILCIIIDTNIIQQKFLSTFG